MNRLRYSVNLSYEILDPTGAFQLIVEARQVCGLRASALTPRLHAARYTVRANKGPLAIRYEAVVDIDHRLDDGMSLTEVPLAGLPFDVLSYLAPSRYCESDRMMEFALRELGRMLSGFHACMQFESGYATICAFFRNRPMIALPQSIRLSSAPGYAGILPT